MAETCAKILAMTPLERAVMAVNCSAKVENIADEPDGVTGDEPLYVVTNPEAVARAVLAAIRNPGEAVMEEGAGVIPCVQGAEEGPLNTADARACWQSMIDAILDETRN